MKKKPKETTIKEIVKSEPQKGWLSGVFAKHEEKKQKKERRKQALRLHKKMDAAIKNHDCDTIRQIAEQGGLNINYGLKLHMAIDMSTPEVLQTLLDCGTNPAMYKEAANTWLSALEYAVYRDRPEMTSILLKDPRTENPDEKKFSYNGGNSCVWPSPIEKARSWKRTDHLEMLELEAAKRFVEKYRNAQKLIREEKRRNLCQP